MELGRKSVKVVMKSVGKLLESLDMVKLGGKYSDFNLCPSQLGVMVRHSNIFMDSG